MRRRIWHQSVWFSQMHIRGKSEDLVIKGMEFNFAILYPYLTEKGRKGHRAYIAVLKEEKAQEKLAEYTVKD